VTHQDPPHPHCSVRRWDTVCQLLLEALRNARVEIEGIETEVVCVVRRGAIGLPRIARIDIVLKPTVAEVSESVRRCAESYEKHCTVTSSVREGIDIQVAVDWQALKEPAE
jgi:hypothetical protein